MTPDPTGIEALLAELAGLEELRFKAPTPVFRRALHDAAHELFPAITVALRSQSRALAEREETIAKLRGAIEWMSGSPSFGPDGEAGATFRRAVLPLLRKDALGFLRPERRGGEERHE